MERKQFAGKVAAVFALAVFAWAVTIAPPATAGEKVVIGHPEALSGRYAKAGEQAAGGIQAAVSWINDSFGGIAIDGKRLPLEYTFYDCESNGELVESLLERLIKTDQVNFTFAPYSSELTLAAAAVTEKHHVLLMDHGGASDEIFEKGFRYVVQTIGPGSQYHAGTLRMVQEIDPEAKRVALAYQDDEFARSVMEGAEQHARKLGFDIVFKQTFPSGTTDLKPLLADLKATKPDIVLGGGHLEDGELFNRQLADLNVNPRLLSLIAAPTLPAFRESLGDLAEGVMGPSHWEYGVTFSKEAAEEAGLEWIGPSQDEFVEFFRKAVGRDLVPDYHAAEAAAAVLALVKGIEKAGTLDTVKVRRALGNLQFMSFYGTWDVDDTGKQIGHSMVDVQWQGMDRVIVWPEAARTAPVVYPKPPFRN